MKSKECNVYSRLKSFRYAIKGMQRFFLDEPNARIHLLLTVAVFIAATYLRVPAKEFALLVIVVGMVWMAEIFNTAVERIMDFISPGYNEKVKVIKDISAAAVLVSSIIAAAVGLTVLVPKII